MENKRFLIVAAIAVCITMLPHASASAYAVPAHKALHKNIVQEYQRLSGKRFSASELEAFISGAGQEDSLARPLNHFYDPVSKRGLSYSLLPKQTPSMQWATNPYMQGNFTGLRHKVFKDKGVNLFEYSSDNSWGRAVYEYVHGDKQRAMQSLGQVMHLLEDLTSVPHTRNDAHGGWGRGGSSYYEDYTATKVPNVELPEVQQLVSIEDIFTQTAMYTNSNFLSRDTVFTGYTKPGKSIDDESDYFENKNGNILARAFFDFDRKTGERSIISISIEDPKVMQSYWDHLSYKAVESGVALLDLFYREVEEERKRGDLAAMNLSYKQAKLALGDYASRTKRSLFGITGLDDVGFLELDGLYERVRGAYLADAYYKILSSTKRTELAQVLSDYESYALGKSRTPDTSQLAAVGSLLADAVVPVQPPAPSLEQEPRPQPVAPTAPVPSEPVAPAPIVPVVAPAPPPALVPTVPVVTPPVVVPVVPIAPVVVPTPNPFDQGGFAYGGGGVPVQAQALTPTPTPPTPTPTPPPDTAPPTVSLTVSGCYTQATTTCSVYPGAELSYAWSTAATDLAQFAVDDSATTTISTSTSGTATTTLMSAGDVQVITVAATDTTGNVATSTQTITAQVPSIVINEVAWAGTNASSTDEWFELYNNEASAVDLTGMSFSAVGSGLTVPLTGTIGAGSYYLVESSEEATSVPANQVSTFSTQMSNYKDTVLLAVGGVMIDRVTPHTLHVWRSGYHNPGTSPHTMERFLTDGPSNSDTNWGAASLYLHPATDRAGGIIYGTPGTRNSVNYRFTYNNEVDVPELTIDTSRTPYIMDGIYVPSGSKLIIEAGVQAAIFDESSGGITVQGELDVRGTAAAPVIFKAYNDVGHWRGVAIVDGGIATIANAHILQGGDMSTRTPAAILVSASTLMLSDVLIQGSSSQGMRIIKGATTTISSSVIQESVQYGIIAIASALKVDNTTFESNSYGIYHTALSDAVVRGSTFINNAGFAILHDSRKPGVYSSNIGSGNGVNGIFLEGSWRWMNSTGTTTLAYNPLPYALSGLNIRSGTVLSVEPGVVIKGTAEGSVQGKSRVVINDGGTLSLLGTVASPVTFTSLNDPDKSPAAGDWWGIVAEGSGTVTGASTTTAFMLYSDPTTPALW